MKLNLLFLILIFLLPSLSAVAQTWQLVWQDEFTNGIGPDWLFETGNGGNGWGNKELQFYQSKNAITSSSCSTWLLGVTGLVLLLTKMHSRPV